MAKLKIKVNRDLTASEVKELFGVDSGAVKSGEEVSFHVDDVDKWKLDYLKKLSNLNNKRLISRQEYANRGDVKRYGFMRGMSGEDVVKSFKTQKDFEKEENRVKENTVKESDKLRNDLRETVRLRKDSDRSDFELTSNQLIKDINDSRDKVGEVLWNSALIGSGVAGAASTPIATLGALAGGYTGGKITDKIVNLVSDYKDWNLFVREKSFNGQDSFGSNLLADITNPGMMIGGSIGGGITEGVHKLYTLHQTDINKPYTTRDKIILLGTLFRDGEHSIKILKEINEVSKLISELKEAILNGAKGLSSELNAKENYLQELLSGRTSTIEAHNADKVKSTFKALKDPKMRVAAKRYITANTVEDEEKALTLIAKLNKNLYTGQITKTNYSVHNPVTVSFGKDYYGLYGHNAGKAIRESINFKTTAGTKLPEGSIHSFGRSENPENYSRILNNREKELVNKGGSVINTSESEDILTKRALDELLYTFEGDVSGYKDFKYKKDPGLIEKINKEGELIGELTAESPMYTSKGNAPKQHIIRGDIEGIATGGINYKLFKVPGKRSELYYIVPVDSYKNFKGRGSKYGGKSWLWNILGKNETPHVLVGNPIKVDGSSIEQIYNHIRVKHNVFNDKTYNDRKMLLDVLKSKGVNAKKVRKEFNKTYNDSYKFWRERIL